MIYIYIKCEHGDTEQGLELDEDFMNDAEAEHNENCDCGCGWSDFDEIEAYLDGSEDHIYTHEDDLILLTSIASNENTEYLLKEEGGDVERVNDILNNWTHYASIKEAMDKIYSIHWQVSCCLNYDRLFGLYVSGFSHHLCDNGHVYLER